MSTNAIRIAVTGAAGQIGYSLLFRIAAGEIFGPNQPVILHLIEVDVPEILEKLKGTVMEIEDCAFPLLKGVVATGNLDEGFKGVNWCLLVGAAPRCCTVAMKSFSSHSLCLMMSVTGRVPIFALKKSGYIVEL